MTAAAVPADMVPPRPAWRSLLWLISLTVLWIVLIYWQSIIPVGGVPTTAHKLMAHGLIAVGLWLGLESTDVTPGQRRASWLALIIPYSSVRCRAKKPDLCEASEYKRALTRNWRSSPLFTTYGSYSCT
jgi:hypothetical protein